MKLIGIAVIAGGLLFVVAGAIGSALSTACLDPDCGTRFATPIGLVMPAAGIVEIVAAVQLKSGKAWAWLVGVVLGLGGPLLGLLVLSIAGDFDIVLALVVLVPNGFVVYALVTSRQWLSLRRA